MPTTKPDRVAELEEERRFLLRSIADLDREYGAGDVDEHDYTALRDGYVDRAADVLRAISESRAALVDRPPRSWKRIAAGVAVTVIIAVLAGWWVAHSSGQRLAGQSITGGAPVDQVAAKLTQARQLMASDPAGAIKLYQDVRRLDPTNAEARTYTAWLLALSSRNATPEVAAVALTQSLDELQAVTTGEPDYPDAWCFLAVVHGNFEQPPDHAGAQSAAQSCLDHEPPAAMRSMIQSFLDAQTATAASTTG